MVGIGADVGVAARFCLGDELLLIKTFGTGAVECEFFVSVQRGFVVPLDFVFGTAHIAEAVEMAHGEKPSAGGKYGEQHGGYGGQAW